MKKNNWQAPIALGCVILGILIVVQFKVQKKEGFPLSAHRSTELVMMIKDLEKERRRLEEEIAQLRGQINQYEQAALKEKSLLKVLSNQLMETKMQAGLIPVKGPGIVITLKDSTNRPKPGEDPYFYLVHDIDLQQLITELWAAGAEAIAVGEQRVVIHTAIRCVGPTILVNSMRLSPPYIVKAIGDPNSLETALKMRGGYLDAMSVNILHGVEIKIKKENMIEIPAYIGGIIFKFAQPVKEMSP